VRENGRKKRKKERKKVCFMYFTYGACSALCGLYMSCSDAESDANGAELGDPPVSSMLSAMSMYHLSPEFSGPSHVVVPVVFRLTLAIFVVPW
jgi:hypothetical protein